MLNQQTIENSVQEVPAEATVHLRADQAGSPPLCHREARAPCRRQCRDQQKKAPRYSGLDGGDDGLGCEKLAERG